MNLIQKQNPKKMIGLIFLFSFTLAISTALLAYVQSSFLAGKINATWVGGLFTLSYLVSFLGINYYSRIISKFGHYRVFLTVLVSNALSLFLLPRLEDTLAIASFFVLSIVSLSLYWLSLDIFLQGYTTRESAGKIRGANLTLMNLGWLVSPALSGYLIETRGFQSVFTISSLLLLPVLILSAYFFQETKGSVKSRAIPEPFSVIQKIIAKPSLRSIFSIAFLLQFFYSWMVIYTPIYLRTLGFSFADIGILFTIMLVPFVLFQFPAGYLADKYFGETEMLSMALVIMGFATASLFFVNSFWVLAIVLFFTRVGASIVESLRDSYFYKQIRPSDIYLINLFRDTGPLAYIAAPALASFLLFFLPMEYLFVILGIIMLSGLYFTMTMPDTK
ncbi:MAG: putative integral membrane transport protein [Parcubacteria group bacterium Gr01-1014_18]|nr:MAG: putative integral membrane transport protein [Parcubacteria group bacterium Greene0416_36]TSC79796.1 MAG: putative integral membrane transport protein [Parcubacteria group bacterium Gr01-1014_18]TSC98080.1 MAG: putative integral membrane transport protein [Parcubacteria group bacterium Greene1014_20]TSD06515.1 MAG: putative integral membrane transport protein [Parcubacteria group bacterium Greene0714_2]